MTLQLSATPLVVAREELVRTGKRPGVRQWVWTLKPDDRVVLRLMVTNGAAGTAQRRDADGVTWLVAWDVSAQRAAAAERPVVERGPVAVRQGRGRVYLPPARMRAGPTHAPFCFEPAAW